MPIKGSDMILKSSHLNFDELKQKYFEETGRIIKAVKRRTELSFKGSCPHCEAHNDYIYDNNGRGQYKCKVCSNTFHSTIRCYEEAAFYCPHCNSKLQVSHDRNDYLVFKCINDSCIFYLDSLRRQKLGDKSLRTVFNCDKLRYYHRDFKFKLSDFNECFFSNTKVNLTNIHHTKRVVGLVSTYLVNYGMSSRKASCLMKDVHNIDISHQTIMNYAEASASFIQHLVAKHKYNLNDTTSGDQT